jgi:hypothetical protein
MMLTTVTLDTFVDRALMELQGPAEVGARVVMGSNALVDGTDAQFLLTGTTQANPSDLIEFGSELLLVTAKTTDVDPLYTVARGYYGSTNAGAVAAGSVGTVNPTWSRMRVGEAVRRAFPRLEALGLPVVKSGTFTRTAGLQYVSMPTETRSVQRVGYFGEDGRFWEIDRWRYFEDVPTSVISTGKIVRLPAYVADTDALQITYTTPYRWSTWPSNPIGASTIGVPEGAEDLPSSYAVAWLLSAREISRSDLDRAEEWNRGEPQRGGVSLSLARAAWQNFYRQLDEARRLDPVTPARPYIKMARF